MRLKFLLLLAFLCESSQAEVNIERIAKDRWLEVRSENFIIITDADEKVGRALVRDLENFRYFIHFMQKEAVIDNPPPLKVFAIKSGRTFRALDLPAQWAGVFLKQTHEDIAIANISDFKLNQNKAGYGNQVLLHEYLHYASRTFYEASHYPLWYSEGEADYFGSFRFAERGKSVSIGSMSVIGTRVRSLMNSSGKIESIDVEDLFKTKRIEMGWRRGERSGGERRRAADEASKFYARAMFTYHYLSRSAQALEMKSKYLSLINTGMDIDTAFSFAFNMTWEELDKEILDYLSSNKLLEWRFGIGGQGLVFPEIEANVRELDRSEIISETVGAMTRVGNYSVEEVESLFSYAKDNGVESVSLAVAEIDWRSSNRVGVIDTIAAAQDKYADDPLVRAWAARTEAPRVHYLLSVDHPSANNELATLRNVNRSVLGDDPFNRLAYYNLGMLTATAAVDDPALLKEAQITLDSAKLLMNEGWRRSILSLEIHISSLLHDPDRLLMQKNQLATIDDGNWITSGYGRFVKESLELRQIGRSTGELGDSSIHYAEGSRYEGEVADGKPNGQGVVFSYYGAKLSGKFAEGRLDGVGELTTSNGYNYVGDFEDGVIAGNGTLEFPVDREELRQSGEFSMGQEHGYQKIEYRNGDILSGNFRSGALHGDVTYTKKDASPVEREFYLGRMRYRISETLLYAGSYDEEYLPHDSGVCYYSDVDEVYPCVFEHGELKTVNKDRNLVTAIE